MATGQSGGEPEASPDHNFSSDYPMQLPPKHEDHIADILPDAVNHAIASEDHLQHVGQAAASPEDDTLHTATDDSHGVDIPQDIHTTPNLDHNHMGPGTDHKGSTGITQQDITPASSTPARPASEGQLQHGERQTGVHESNHEDHTDGLQDHTAVQEDHTAVQEVHTAVQEDHTVGPEVNTGSQEEHTAGPEIHTTVQEEDHTAVQDVNTAVQDVNTAGLEDHVGPPVPEMGPASPLVQTLIERMDNLTRQLEDLKVKTAVGKYLCITIMIIIII